MHLFSLAPTSIINSSPRSVTQAIIHHLKIIDIHKQNSRYLLPMSLDSINHSLQPVQKQNAIGQTGQLVMTCVE
jgi:hypothetical protein